MVKQEDVPGLQETSENVAVKAIKGIKYNLITTLSLKIFTFLANIYLFRLLDESIFGIFALSIFLVDFLNRFEGLGTGPAFIFIKTNPKKVFRNAFTLTLITNVIISLLVFIIAPYYAKFVNAPEITPYVRVCAFLPLIFILGFTKQGLIKDLRFKSISILNITKSVVYLGLALTLAYFGFKVWALIISYLFAEFLVAMLSLYISDYKPKINFNRRILKHLLKFSMPIMIGYILSGLSANVQSVILGKFTLVAVVGYFYFANKISLLPSQIMDIVSGVIFPTLSRIRENSHKAKIYFLKFLKYSSILVVPAYVGLAIIAKPFIEIIYTSKWSPAILVSQILLITMMFLPSSVMCSQTYLALGKTKTIRNFAFYEASMIIGLGSVATYFFGIIGLASVIFFKVIISYFIHSYLIKKYLGLSLIMCNLKIYVSSGIMGIFLLFVNKYITNVFWLILIILISILIYFIALYFIEGKELFVDVKRIIKKAF